MRVYISGKIGSDVITPEIKEKFGKAQAMLEAKGFEVFNPVSDKWQAALKRSYEKDRKAEEPWIEGKFPDFYTYCLLRDQMTIATKDAVYFLEDFRGSDGATSEFYFARAIGKNLMFQTYFRAETYLGEIYDGLVRKGMPPLQREEGESDYALLRRYIELNINSVWLPL